LKKRTVFGLSLLIIASFFLAGCFGDEEPKFEPPPVEGSASLQSQTGWLDSGSEASPSSIDLPVVLMDANASEDMKITRAVFVLKWEDSDSEHSDTDEGSDPDTATLTVTGGSFSESGSSDGAGGTVTLELPLGNETAGSDEEIELPSQWTATIAGEYGGGKPAKAPSGRDMFLFVYYDQGLAYSLDVSFEFVS